MTKHYYAEFSPYGSDTICTWGDQLCMFNSRKDRDDFVKMCNREAGYYGHNFAEPIKLKDAARKYPVRRVYVEWLEEAFRFDADDHTISGPNRYYWTVGTRSDYIA